MFKDMLINPNTKEALEIFIKAPSHAVLITGPVGAGKTMVAKSLAAQLLQTDLEKLNSQSNFLHIKKLENKKDITIEQVRGVTRELGLKVPSKAKVKRVIFIDDAQSLSLPAQNALLKSLEEPSTYSVFILTAPSKSDLLPTIISRVTKIAVHPIHLAEAKKFFKNSAVEVESAWNLSRGYAGLMNSLLAANSTELTNSVELAKKILKLSAYERTLELDKISKDKADFDSLLDALSRIIQALYTAAAEKNETTKLKKLTHAMSIVLSARCALEANALPRLVALEVAVNLPI